MSIADKLQTIKTIKENIKTSINNKGGNVGDNFNEYATAIDNISTGGSSKISIKDTGLKFGNATFTEVPENFDFNGVTDYSYMFENCQNLTKAPAGINTTNTKNLSYMYDRCYKLTTAEVDLTNATNTSYMFRECGNLSNLKIHNFPQTLEEADYMFNGCGVTSLNLGVFTANSMRNMFQGCEYLQTITLYAECTGDNAGSAAQLFDACYELREVNGYIKVENITTANRMQYMFRDCTKLEKLCEVHTNGGGNNSLRMFSANMDNLTDFGGVIGLKFSQTNYFLQYCPNLSYQSCINVLNGLYDFTGNGETPSSAQGKLKVTQSFLDTVGDEVSIAVNKGWTLQV